MNSLKRTVVSLPGATRPDFPTRLDERRIHRLGHGARVDRRRLRLVCGTASAANQWLHKASKEGILVPVAWGEYQVVDEDVLDHLRHATRAPHRRLISWALTLPTTLDPRVTFLAPVVWRHTHLRWEHPAPIAALEASRDRPPAQLEVLGYSVVAAEEWSLSVGDRPPISVPVPSRLDATILLGSNIDEAWQRAALRLAEELGPSERLLARRQLARLRRFGAAPGPQGIAPEPVLRTPQWWDNVHNRAVERLVRKKYAI